MCMMQLQEQKYMIRAWTKGHNTEGDCIRVRVQLQLTVYSQVVWCHHVFASDAERHWDVISSWGPLLLVPEPACQCLRAGQSHSWCLQTASESYRLACWYTSHAGPSAHQPARQTTHSCHSCQFASSVQTITLDHCSAKQGRRIIVVDNLSMLGTAVA